MTSVALRKSVAIYIDGTGNSKGDPFPSNVAVLSDRAGGEYLPGIASQPIAPDLDPVRQAVYRAFGRYFALGLSGKVTEAYARLCSLYERGHSLYLFGFSRGACAARLVAGFADEVGVLLKDKLDRVDEAWRLYLTDGDAEASDLRDFLRQVTGTATKPSAEGGNQLPIHFLGVWDTVAMWFNVGDRPFDVTTRLTRVPSNIHHARHALAIHEVRRYFPELLWLGQHRVHSNQSVAQVWFPGNHADVGGGYAERDLADVALDWMIAEAGREGLAIAPDSRAHERPIDSRSSKLVHDESSQSPSGLSTGTRAGLKDWDNFDPAIQRTTFVDRTYLRRLVSGDVLTYQDSIPRASRRAMDRAEDLVVQLHALNVFARADRPPPAWVRQLASEDVLGCAARVRTFIRVLAPPGAQELDTFTRELLLWVICEGADAGRAVAETIESASAEFERRYLIKNHQALRSFRGWLDKRSAMERSVAAASANVPAEFGLSTVLESLERRTKMLDRQWWDTSYRTPSETDILAPPTAKFRKKPPAIID